MPDTKKIIDELISFKKNNRNKFIKEAMTIYTREEITIHIREDMKKGYIEMSQINISLSEMGLAEDIRELCIYEMNLTGSGEQ